MSLVKTQSPYQTIDNEVSDWNAVGNPVLYKMQRKDFTFASITNSGGFVRLVLDSSFGNVASSFDVDDEVYFITDGGVYDVVGTVTASSYSAPNTLVTLDTTYISSSTGFVNNDDLRPSYRVEVEVYNSDDIALSDATFSYSPTSKGALTIDISSILKANMSPDQDADLTTNTTVFTDTNVFTGFYIKYREVWTGSAESQTNDSSNEFFGLLGAMQIPSTYGGNIYDYLILGDMKKAEVTITTAQILTGNTVPVDVIAAPGANKIIVPVAAFIFYDYNSIAYATNVDFQLQINGLVIFTAANMLDQTADRFLLQTLQSAGVTGTTYANQALKFKVSTGDPTAGNSPLKITVIYTIIDLL